MIYKRRYLLFPLFLVVGCAQIVPEKGFNDVELLVSERLDKRVQWNQNSEDDAKVKAAVQEMLKNDLTPDGAVQIALLNNPELQATYEKLGIAQADLVQAGLLKNPIFDAELHFVAGGIGAGTNLNLIQDFISLFQLPSKKRIALAAFESTKLEVADAILNLASEVKTSYFSLQGAAELLDLRRKIVEGLQVSTEMSQRQHKVGNITDLDLATAQAAYAKAKLDLTLAEANVADEREKLNLLLGLWEAGSIWHIASRLPDPPQDEIALEGLDNLAITNRFDLQATKKEIESLGAALGLTEKYRLIPDLMLGFDLEGETKSKIVPGPNINLQVPIFDQGQGRVAGAEALLRQAQKKYIAQALRARSEVRTASNHMLSARARVEYAKKTLMPVSQQIVEQTQLEYNGMLVGVFQLISAKKDEIEAKITYIDALKDYWFAQTDLEKAVGGSFSTHESSVSKEN